MAYRSFKRVLVETSLERKCLLLFGISLFVVIASAFWFVERVAEKQIKETARQIGQNYGDVALWKYHMRTTQFLQPKWRSLYNDLQSEMDSRDLNWDILFINEEPTIDKIEKVTRPVNDAEEPIVVELMSKLIQSVEERQLQEPTPPPLEEQTEDTIAETDLDANAPIVDPKTDANKLVLPSKVQIDEGNYIFYRPIQWKAQCIECHVLGEGMENEFEIAALPGPTRIIRIEIPNEEMNTAVIKSRAILLATAIITVFLAIIALYLVVRFIIIRPLNHLRDVSDEISRGNTNLRADIQTNDEFEDLAASFNRMLRHLVDAQEELQTVNASLDGKVDELAQANMRLHEMNRVKSEFLANMSHELRTPLNSIIGFSDVLRSIDALNTKQKRYVQNIGSSGRVLLEMINDILDLAKMESGKMDLKLSHFDIHRVVTAQCDLVRALAEEKNIDMELVVQKELPAMFQDQAKIQQILMNLLSNAIKFTPEGGRIKVMIKQDHEDFLIMQVEDTGVGIADEDRAIIFEKFRQAQIGQGEDNLTREFSGTGLGLSIVKELSRLLGGEVSFESELGKGSCFTIRIPWKMSEQPRSTNDLAARLDEVTKSNRIEFRRNETQNSPPANAPN